MGRRSSDACRICVVSRHEGQVGRRELPRIDIVGVGGIIGDVVLFLRGIEMVLRSLSLAGWRWALDGGEVAEMGCGIRPTQQQRHDVAVLSTCTFFVAQLHTFNFLGCRVPFFATVAGLNAAFWSRYAPLLRRILSMDHPIRQSDQTMCRRQLSFEAEAGCSACNA